jgi:hypothetical protein
MNGQRNAHEHTLEIAATIGNVCDRSLAIRGWFDTQHFAGLVRIRRHGSNTAPAATSGPSKEYTTNLMLLQQARK